MGVRAGFTLQSFVFFFKEKTKGFPLQSLTQHRIAITIK
ncbi:hypothetical protein FCR2A7T_22270 [Flavobacterium cauense R2A-7]|nr:hypothetical protein FCR2A7T_22270 [Flavobacterium cauense R2A-7]